MVDVSSFSLPVRFMEGCAVVSLPCEVDYGNADMVRRVLQAVLNKGVAGVVADMTATRFCDAAGVRAVVRAHNRAEGLGCWVRVVISHSGVRKPFVLTGADSLVRIYASLNHALPRGRDAAGQPALPGPLVLHIPRQAGYPELVAPWEAGESAAALQEEPWARPPVPATPPATPRSAGPGEFPAAPAGQSPGQSGGQPGPGHDLAPEERTRGLVAQLRSACDHSRAARHEVGAVCARLAVTCAHVAATHERLAQCRPDEAARLLSISQAARDRATAYRRLATGAQAQ